jgi:hypothetical protein
MAKGLVFDTKKGKKRGNTKKKAQDPVVSVAQPKVMRCHFLELPAGTTMKNHLPKSVS